MKRFLLAATLALSLTGLALGMADENAEGRIPFKTIDHLIVVKAKIDDSPNEFIGPVVAVAVADPSLPFQKGQAVQRQSASRESSRCGNLWKIPAWSMPPLRHEQMQVRVEVDPVAEGLDRGIDRFRAGRAVWRVPSVLPGRSSALP